MMCVAYRCAVVAAGAWLTAALAWGQVSQVQTGNALDANPQLGSGGYNQPAGAIGGVNSQLYVTGQVSGLAGFRGQPYFGADQLRLSLPSAGLDTFNRQSVGMTQVLNDQTIRPIPYFTPSQTAFGVAGIVGGFSAPGTNAPAYGSAPADVARRLYQDATAEYRSLLELRPAREAASAAPAGIGVKTSPLTGDEKGPAMAAPSSVEGGAMFNVVRQQNQQEQAARQLLQNERDPNAPVDLRLNLEADPTAERVPQASDRAEPGAGQPGREIAPARPASDYIKPNQDVYLDVLMQLRQRQMGETPAAEPADEAPAVKPAAPADRAPQAKDMKDLTPSPSGEDNWRIVELDRQKGVVIHGLAGLSPDAFNKEMAAGEEKLRAGKYHEAIVNYRMAVTINPNNPMGNMGLALAVFPAGEAYTAGFQIKRALQQLPPLMETRIDLAKLVGGDDLSKQLKLLDSRLDGREKNEPMLVLVATFLHQNLGHRERAQSYAKRLGELAGTDRLLLAYATFIQTGQRPSAAAKPQTAR